jgi:trans-aconitate methyltransferase
MLNFPDISEYYTGELAAHEEYMWRTTQQYKNNLEFLNKTIAARNVQRMVEVGCGSGFIPTGLPDGVRYLGVDNNPTFLAWAKDKNPNRAFEKADIRALSLDWLKGKGYAPFDLVATFAVLKHFGLHEWDDVVKTILGLAPVAVFDVQLTNRDLDNGTAFHHSFVTGEHLERVVAAAGHRIVHRVTNFLGSFPQGEMRVDFVETKRVK